MSKTALITALKTFDLDRVRAILKGAPDLRRLDLGKGLNLLQFCSQRFTGDDTRAADRQLRLAKWLVDDGFDPVHIRNTA